MDKKWFAFWLVIALASFAAFSGGCGQAVTGTATTIIPAAQGVTIKGGTSSTAVTGLGLRSYASLAGAEVIIGIPTKGADAITEVARGTTDSEGNYSITVATSEFSSAKGDNNYAANIMITISKEGTVIGCVLSSLSLEAGTSGFATTANPGDYVKAKIARKMFKSGTDPKSFDFTGSLDSKFSSGTLKDYDEAKMDKLAGSLKGAEDAEDDIALGLGISAENLAKMKNKGQELFKLYIEPIMKAAFEAKTPPDRDAMDAAFNKMEADMKTYATGTLGLTEQQFADLRAFKDKGMETEMGEAGFVGGDPAFDEAKRKMMASKISNLFQGQWAAADTIATLAPTGKQSFKDFSGSAAIYNKFVASKEVIVAQLNAFMTTAGTTPDLIPNYLRTHFFDAYIFQPMGAAKPTPPSPTATTQEAAAFQASMESMMTAYANSRIMVYFMQTFLNQTQRMTYFTSQESAMQPIFRNRFENTGSPYYMGPTFWSTNPTADQIKAKLVLYNAALDAAMDNNLALQSIFVAAGFTSGQATTILRAFRILMAPPDMF